jgi:hypothetical protein
LAGRDSLDFKLWSAHEHSSLIFTHKFRKQTVDIDDEYDNEDQEEEEHTIFGDVSH